MKLFIPVVFAICLLFTATRSSADTMWVFDGATFEDGGSVSGSFTISSDSGQVLSYDFHTSGGSALPLGAEYSSVANTSCFGLNCAVYSGFGNGFTELTFQSQHDPCSGTCVLIDHDLYVTFHTGGFGGGLPDVGIGGSPVTTFLCSDEMPCFAYDGPGDLLHTGGETGEGGTRAFDPAAIIGSFAGPVAPVPEPASILLLLAAGLVGLGATRRRKLPERS
jgi:hypothetical protein